jgi:hypothetical protein
MKALKLYSLKERSIPNGSHGKEKLKLLLKK